MSEEVKIGDLIHPISIRGHQLKRSEYEATGALPIIDQGEELFCGFTDDLSKRLSKPEGVVVFGDHTRIVKYFAGDFVAGADGTKVLQPTDPNLSAQLLFHIISLAANSLTNLGYARHFSLLREAKVWLPPLSERAKIVEILSDCDAEIEQMEQQLQSMKRGFESFCNTAWRLGTHSESLGQIGNFFQGLAGKSANDFGKGERFVTYMGVFNGPYVKDSGFGLVSVGADEKQSRLIDGDLLITMTSESKAEAGLTAIFRTNDTSENVFLNSFCAGFRLNEDSPYSSELVHALMQSSQLRAAIWRISQGSTRINLSRKELSKINLSLPEPDMSLLLSNAVRDFAEQQDQAKRALIERKRFKRGLMQQLLTGKLRVKGAA